MAKIDPNGNNVKVQRVLDATLKKKISMEQMQYGSLSSSLEDIEEFLTGSYFFEFLDKSPRPDWETILWMKR